MTVGVDAQTIVARKRRADERCRLLAWVADEIVGGLERLADERAPAAHLIALADRQSRALRAEVERRFGDGPLSLHGADEIAADERTRVRGHLHDTALQILEVIAGDGFGTGFSAEKIANLARVTARDLRRWVASGGMLANDELVPALELIAAREGALSSRVEVVVEGFTGAPTAEQVEALTGAVREAVTNARKHGRASRVVVAVSSDEDGGAAVRVSDDGVGIDPARVAASNGFGVEGSIKGRMRRIGGRASIEGVPGGGTLVTLVAPSRGGRR